MLHTSDFDFELPPELIASHPLAARDASRMLVVNGTSLSDAHIRDFVDYLRIFATLWIICNRAMSLFLITHA